MIDNKTIQKIEEFVSECPRSINEIAMHINKNWRTVDRYVKKISEEYGTISFKTFRKGTRGALKIVYWSGVKKHSNVFQKEMEEKIRISRKEDFKAFDIYQHVSKEKKEVIIVNDEEERIKDFIKLLSSAKKQILFFSGNLSFINFKGVFKKLEDLIKKDVSIKIICRVSFDSLNVKKLLSLNKKYKKDLIEIRHRIQPLRVTIIDGKVVNLKEVVNPSERKKELSKKLYLFYTIKDQNWVKWMENIFWNMFNNSISAEKRLKELDELI